MNHVMKEKNLKMRIFLLKHPDKGICMFDRSTSYARSMHTMMCIHIMHTYYDTVLL